MTDITVLIVDDQPFMLYALQAFIENKDGAFVAGTAEDGEIAVEAAKSLQPDLVLMGIKILRLNGIEATRKVVSEIPGIWVPALTTFPILGYVVSALRAGAAGYLVKNARPDETLAVTRNVMDDSLPLSPSMVRLIARQVTGGALDTQAITGVAVTEVGLAPRETSVLQFLGGGLSNREMVKEMYIPEGLVKVYLANACTKLGVGDCLQAMIRGFELSIISPRLSANE